MKATCCPTRQAVYQGYCKMHIPRTLVLEAHTGPVPETCPHCAAGAPGWSAAPTIGHCVYCGELWLRRLAVVGA